MTDKPRDEELRAIRKQYPLLYPIAVAILLVIILLLVGYIVYSAPDVDRGWDYGVNVFTSVVSTVFTVSILEVLNRRRDERNAEAALKRQLINETASLSNEIAKNAVTQLRRNGWLYAKDSVLRGKDLRWANLHHTFLMLADFQKTRLNGANFQDADLMWADFQGADLFGADFQRADLVLANLQDANLRDAKLQGARLWEANLQGAKNIDSAIFDSDTILPTKQNWKPEIDMERFTNPEHPNFWRSAFDQSPAYRGDSTT